MDWTVLHSYAVEADLWTSLAINCWLIIGGIVFLLVRINRSRPPITDQIGFAAFCSFMILWGVFTVSLAYKLIVDDHDIMSGIGIVFCGIFLAVVIGGMTWLNSN